MPRAKELAPVSRTDINARPCRLAGKPANKFIVTGSQPGGRRWWRFFETRALVGPEEAARYWAIRPAAASANVVPMQVGTA